MPKKKTKNASKKATSKKTVAKKTAPKKPAPKKSAVKKAPPKKTTAKTSAIKNAATEKKTPAKKSATKKTGPFRAVSAESSDQPSNVEKKPASGRSQNAQLCPIVGIGASAGGLEAMEAFFKAVPKDPGMAFVVVVHLDPTHVSILPELLQKSTEMPVTQVNDGMLVEANKVYVIPPNKELQILNRRLRLLDVTGIRAKALPIDTFLRSLAQDQERQAVCVILSGTGTDGTLGLRAIKGLAGMAMVQSEESAKYDGMPRSAIGTGLADYVLPPEKMSAQLLKFAEHLRDAGSEKIGTRSIAPGWLEKVFVILRARTDHDFSLYKKNTLYRRIERRMNVHQISEISSYVRLLQESDREAPILFKELLIGVTSFFRDPQAFEALETTAIPKLLSGKPDNYTVRVWIPGCATGEEAYSIAMSLRSCIEKTGKLIHAQIFATDIDEDAIGVARSGVYPHSIEADVPSDRLRRFFTKEEDGLYRVNKTIREMLVFAPQNVIKDPPFTKLDMISCRNLLIYLGPELQRKLLPIFHYSLREDGILLLGSSETIGQSTDLFSQTHKKWKIFRKKPASGTKHVPEFPTPAPLQQEIESDRRTVADAEEISALQLVETILHQSDTPPSAIINQANDVVYIHGRTGRFLEPAEGKASVNIVEMARPGLKEELAAAIGQVTNQRQEVVCGGIKVDYNGGTINLTLKVKPIVDQPTTRGLLMVVFEEASASGTDKKKKKKKNQRQAQKNADELEQQLQHTKESLHTTIEELETSNEELKSTNEELQSTNEELQSTNEELETSKEELQSLNEESATVNAELQARIEELSRANDDLKNLLDSTDIATVFLDTELRVRRYTPSATKIIPFAATDVGRPVKHLASTLLDADLSEQGRLVLDDLSTRNIDVESEDGRQFLMRVKPYRTVTNVIDGVVITFEDISELQQLKRLAVVVRDSNDAITLQNADGTIVAWNHGAERIYGYSEAEALRMNISEIVPMETRSEAKAMVKKVLQGEEVGSFKTQRISRDGKALDVVVTATLIHEEGSGESLIATTERDLTQLSKFGR